MSVEEIHDFSQLFRTHPTASATDLIKEAKRLGLNDVGTRLANAHFKSLPTISGQDLGAYASKAESLKRH